MTAGTCLGGSATTINLATTASDVDSAYRGMSITLTGGTGSGQTRYISGYRIDRDADDNVVGRVVIIDGTFNPVPVTGSTTYSIVSKTQSELQLLSPSAIIELYQITLYADLHGVSDTYYFHAGTNDLHANVVYDQNTYNRLPIIAEGFKYSSTGPLPRPKLQLSNLSDVGTQLILLSNGFNPGSDLSGATVTRIRTLKKFIDAANYAPTYTGTYNQPGTQTVTVTIPGGHTLQVGNNVYINITSGSATDGPRTITAITATTFTYTAPDQPTASGNVNVSYSATADPLARMPTEIYLIDNRTQENRDVVMFELAAAIDLDGVRIPKRQVIANLCQWRYRSVECSYTGTNYFNNEDQSVPTANLDVCGKRLSSCKKRFGTGTLPFGSFPGVGQRR